MVEFFSQQPLTCTEREQSFLRTYGGDALNCLVAASRLGARCGFITRVGDDPFAEFLLNAWRAEGIDLGGVRRVPGFNGIYFISVSGAGEREFTYYRFGSAASTLSPEDVEGDYLRRAKVFHSSGITQAISASARAAVREAFRRAKELGLRTSFDPNFRPRLWNAEEARGALEEILPYVDIFLPSLPSDTQPLLGLLEAEAVIRWFWERGATVVAVKRGEKGCAIGHAGQVEALPAYPVEPVDTTGAGDAFDGAFLSALARGKRPRQAARLALAAAALSTRRRGAIAGLPTMEEVAALLEAYRSNPGA